MSLALRVVSLLAAIWVVALAIFWGVRANRPTPEKIEAYIAANPLPDRDAQERAAVLDKVANQLNRLEFEERRRLQRQGTMRGFFETMTSEEQNRFLDRTLPEGFRQVMLALNKMDPDRRRKIVERALEQVQEGNPPGEDTPPPDSVDEAMMQKIMAQGMTSFYEDANSEVKLDFAPVIEQIQQSLQWRD